MGIDVELDSTCLVPGVWNEIELISLDWSSLYFLFPYMKEYKMWQLVSN